MQLIDPDHPFFARAAVRWATVLIPLAWSGVELWGGSPGWAMVFAAAGAYAFWRLILTGPGRKDGAPPGEE